MELYLQYKNEKQLICSSTNIEIDGVIVELVNHNLKDIKSEYIIDTYNNIVSNVIPKTDIEVNLELNIYSDNQEDISNFIDKFDDIKQIQDYNFDMIDLLIVLTKKDKKKVKYIQKIKVLLDNVKVSNNIYNDSHCREMIITLKVPKAIVEILPDKNKDYYYKLRMD